MPSLHARARSHVSRDQGGAPLAWRGIVGLINSTPSMPPENVVADGEVPGLLSFSP